MVKAKKWTLVKAFKDAADMSNFKLEEEKLPDTLKKGEVLCEAIFLTVDPYMRIMPGPVGSPMVGEQVAKVTASQNTDFPVGCFVAGMLGWRTHTIVTDTKQIHIVQDLGAIPLSLHLGAMGMPGMTAYFGFKIGCDAKKGETVFVSGAAGAVGSIVAQIAKIQVGGDFTSTVIIQNMAKNGRIACCGSTSTYQTANAQGAMPYGIITMKLLTLKGIQGWAVTEKWPEGQAEMLKWIKENKVKVRETITTGFDKMAEAFLDLFKGGNIGKAIIKV